MISTFACSPKNAQFPVELYDQKIQKKIRFANYKEILVTPTVDIRKQRRKIGVYRWFNITHTIISKNEKIEIEINKIIQSILVKNGFSIKKGFWDQNPYSLRKINSPFVLYSEIKNLDFYGNASFPNNIINGVVAIEFKLGVASSETVFRTSIELSPKKKTLLSSEKSEDLFFIEKTIRSTTYKTIKEGLEKILRKTRD